jgi:hypothetical protein
MQLVIPETQQAPASFSQQGRSQTSNGKGDERDYVRQASPQETTAAPSGDGINDPGLCLVGLTVLSPMRFQEFGRVHAAVVAAATCRTAAVRLALMAGHACCLQLRVHVASS